MDLFNSKSRPNEKEEDTKKKSSQVRRRAKKKTRNTQISRNEFNSVQFIEDLRRIPLLTFIRLHISYTHTHSFIHSLTHCVHEMNFETSANNFGRENETNSSWTYLLCFIIRITAATTTNEREKERNVLFSIHKLICISCSTKISSTSSLKREE